MLRRSILTVFICLLGLFVAAPVSALTTYTVFDNEIRWRDDSWGTERTVVNGQLQIKYNVGYGGAKFTYPEGTLIGITQISFDVISASGQEIYVLVLDDNDQAHYINTNITLNGPQKVTVTGDFPAHVRSVTLGSNSDSPQAAFVIDNLVLSLDEAYVTPTPTPLPDNDAVNISASVNAGVVVAPFNEEMLGMQLANWEHGFTNPDGRQAKPFVNDVPGLKQALLAANIKLVRYAGGLESNNVGWERSPQRRYREVDWSPTRSKYHPQFANKINTNHVYNLQYGQDEIDDLGEFTKDTGIEVMLQINLEENDPYMWADLLHYANVEKDYDFKYIELSNELDLKVFMGSQPQVSPQEYRKRAEVYVEVLKSVDPDIKIVAGVPATAHDAFVSGHGEAGNAISQYLYESAKLRTPTNKKVDSLSYHWYQFGSGDVKDQRVTLDIIRVFDRTSPTTKGYTSQYKLQPDPNNPSQQIKVYEPFYDPTLSTKSWKHALSRSWARIAPQRIQSEVINPYLPGATMGITELNTESQEFNRAPFHSNQIAAVWQTDVMGRLAYHGLDYVTWYQGYGHSGDGYPAIMSYSDSPSTIYMRPTYYGLFMYGNYFGDRMVQSSSADEENLSVWASTDSDDPGKLKLMITNISENPVKSNIAVSNFSIKKAEGYEMSNPNPWDMSRNSNERNGGTTINGVRLDDMNIAASAATIQPQGVNFSGNTVTHTFPPLSTTAIILSSSGSPLPTATPTVKPTAGPTAVPTSKPLIGDYNLDGSVNVFDFGVFIQFFNRTDCPCLSAQKVNIDLDGNSKVNALDFSIFVQNFNKQQ